MIQRMIQTVKKLMKKCEYLAILEYRNTPLSGDLGSPAQLLQSRRLRSTIPMMDKLLKPKVQTSSRRKLQLRQSKITKTYSRNKKNMIPLKEGDHIRFKKTEKDSYREGEVVQKLHLPRSYTVKDTEGNLYRRNRLFISRRPTNPSRKYLIEQEANKNLQEHKSETTQENNEYSEKSSTLKEQETHINTETTRKTKHSHNKNEQHKQTNIGQSPIKITSSGRRVVKPKKYLDYSK